MPISPLFTRIPALWVLLVSCAGASGAVSSMAARIELIRADSTTLEQARQEYQSLQQQRQLGDAEANDYRVWLARLRAQLVRDCAELERLASDQLPADLPCNSLQGEGLVPVPIDMQAEKTSSESTAALDGELDASLGQFDDKLLREQERIKAATPRIDSGSSGQSGQSDQSGDEGGSSAVAGVAGESGSESTETGEEQAATGSSASTREQAGGGTIGKPGRTVVSTVPDDIPDGSDDDVVARQLREAAEKETDPELRKKLWEEYRKYKQGID